MINQTQVQNGWQAIIHLPKNAALAEHLNRAGCGELAAAAGPRSGGDSCVTLRHRRTAEHLRKLLAAAEAPADAEVAEAFATVHNRLREALSA